MLLQPYIMLPNKTRKALLWCFDHWLLNWLDLNWAIQTLTARRIHIDDDIHVVKVLKLRFILRCLWCRNTRVRLVEQFLSHKLEIAYVRVAFGWPFRWVYLRCRMQFLQSRRWVCSIYGWQLYGRHLLRRFILNEIGYWCFIQQWRSVDVL